MDKQARRHGHNYRTTFEYTSGEELNNHDRKLMGEPHSQWEARAEVCSRPSLSLPSSPPESPTGLVEHGVPHGSPRLSKRRVLAEDEWCRRLHGTRRRSLVHMLQLSFILLICFVRPSKSAFIGFKDCLSPSVINSEPKHLQFTPLLVWASFNSSTSHNLNVTVYGNVSGQATQENLPTDPLDPSWNDPNSTLGKIIDVPKNITTLTGTFNVLDYTPYKVPATRFCDTTVHGQCPIAPVFKNVSYVKSPPCYCQSSRR